MSEIEKLLQELIQASDRTTRAVRAFVRFLFIQLAATTAAAVIFLFGIITQDPVRCAFFGDCQPNIFTTILAALVWVVGVIWSSIAGWGELGLSQKPHSGERSSGRPPYPNGSSPLPRSRTQRASCNECGTTNKPGAVFCGICGKPFI